MKRTERASEHEAIEATAANWLAERDDGLTVEQEAELSRWLAADSRHRAALARLDATWSTLQQLRDFRPHSVRHPDSDLIRVQRPLPRRKYVVPAFSAAAAALFVAILWWFSSARVAPIGTPQIFSTASDGYSSVVLADGSHLELNASTEVQVSFTSKARRVRLVKGEAYFTVAKEPARPFTVEVGKVAVRAVGTAFNISLLAAAVDVVVFEGKVKVTDLPFLGAGKARSAGSPSRYPDLLVANERLLIPTDESSSRRLSSETVTMPALLEAISWKERRLVFAETPLSEVIMQFNRLNRVQVLLGDESLADRPVGGNFQADNLEMFVNLLVKTQEIAAERPSDDVIILRKVK